MAYQGIESEAGIGLALSILSLPSPEGCDPQQVSAVQENLLDCVIRLGEKQDHWTSEMIFANCPVECASDRNKSDTKRVYFTYSRVGDKQEEGCDSEQSSAAAGTENSVVKKLLNNWCSVCRLYQHVVELQAYLKG